MKCFRVPDPRTLRRAVDVLATTDQVDFRRTAAAEAAEDVLIRFKGPLCPAQQHTDSGGLPCRRSQLVVEGRRVGRCSLERIDNLAQLVVGSTLVDPSPPGFKGSHTKPQ